MIRFSVSMEYHKDFVDNCNDKVGGYFENVVDQPWRLLLFPCYIIFLVFYLVYLILYGCMYVCLFAQNPDDFECPRALYVILFILFSLPLYFISIAVSLPIYICLWIWVFPTGLSQLVI